MKRPTYTGGKGGDGVYQFLTNWLKPCHRYVSVFAGLDAVLWNLKNKPNEIWVNDLENSVLKKWQKYFESMKKSKSKYVLTCQDYQDVLTQLSNDYYLTEAQNGRRTTLFLDPSYLMSTRTTQQDYYKRELSTEDEHRELIANIIDFDQSHAKMFDIMITHYPCELYRKEFLHANWTITEFVGRSRNGTRPEWLITNYKKPQALQDYSHIGENSRTRLDNKRKIKRWEENFKNLPPTIRNAIFERFSLTI